MNSYQKVIARGVSLGVLLSLIAPVQGALAQGSYSFSKSFGHSNSYHERKESWNRGKKHRRKSSHRNKNYKGYVGPYKHSHDYAWIGFSYSLPFGAQKVSVEGRNYRYYNGTFYRKCDKRGYDIIPAPHGALVRHLPSKHRVSYRQGKKYYQHEDSYYRRDQGGYRVVSSPHFEINYGRNRNHHRGYRQCSLKRKSGWFR